MRGTSARARNTPLNHPPTHPHPPPLSGRALHLPQRVQDDAERARERHVSPVGVLFVSLGFVSVGAGRAPPVSRAAPPRMCRPDPPTPPTPLPPPPQRPDRVRPSHGLHVSVGGRVCVVLGGGGGLRGALVTTAVASGLRSAPAHAPPPPPPPPPLVMVPAASPPSLSSSSTSWLASATAPTFSQTGWPSCSRRWWRRCVCGVCVCVVWGGGCVTPHPASHTHTPPPPPAQTPRSPLGCSSAQLSWCPKQRRCMRGSLHAQWLGPGRGRVGGGGSPPSLQLHPPTCHPPTCHPPTCHPPTHPDHCRGADAGVHAGGRLLRAQHPGMDRLAAVDEVRVLACSCSKPCCSRGGCLRPPPINSPSRCPN